MDYLYHQLNYMKIYLYILLTFGISSSVSAQNPLNKVWDERYGGTSEDNFMSIQPTTDGGFILGGYSYSNTSGEKSDSCRGSSDYWIIKINSLGVKQWDKTFGGTSIERLQSIILTNDGGYLIGGYSSSGIGGDKTESSWGNEDYWIVKTDSLGNKEWDKRFGGSGTDFLQALEKTDDGCFLIFGYTNSGISGDKTQANWGNDDFWLVKTDSLGNKIWDRRFGGSGADHYCTISSINDGNYLIGGFSSSDISGDKSVPRWDVNGDFWILKIDTSGNKLWDKRYGGIGFDALSFICQTFDDGFLLGGSSYSNGGGDKTSLSCVGSGSAFPDYWIVKIDSAGNKQWDRDVGSESTDHIYYVYQTSDSGYVISGRSDGDIACQKSEDNLGNMQTWAVKTNSSGVKQWDKTFFGPTSLNSNKVVLPSGDSCFIVVNSFLDERIGYNSQSSRGGSDYWLAKFCNCSTNDLPLANFNAMDTTTCTPNCIRFVDVSDCAVSRQWIFPGGIPATSTEQMPRICYPNAGIFSVTLIVANANGTDTLVRNNYVQIYPTPSPVVISQSGDTLISTPGDFYEWHDDNGTITGATNQTFIPDSSGYYYVCVSTQFGCEDCSQNIFYSITSVNELNNNNHFVKIVPNPAHNKFNLIISEFNEKGTIEIIDVLGVRVLSKELLPELQQEINLPDIAPGVYFVCVTYGYNKTIKKLIVE